MLNVSAGFMSKLCEVKNWIDIKSKHSTVCLVIRITIRFRKGHKIRLIHKQVQPQCSIGHLLNMIQVTIV
jgi:hypothetical protein